MGPLGRPVCIAELPRSRKNSFSLAILKCVPQIRAESRPHRARDIREPFSTHVSTFKTVQSSWSCDFLKVKQSRENQWILIDLGPFWKDSCWKVCMYWESVRKWVDLRSLDIPTPKSELFWYFTGEHFKWFTNELTEAILDFRFQIFGIHDFRKFLYRGEDF